MASLRDKIIHGLSWKTASVVLQATTQIIVLAILARYLEPDAFGIVAAANVVIAFIQMLSEAGVGPALIQRKNIDENYIGIALILSTSLGLLFSGVIWGLSDYIESFFGMNGLAEVVQALSITFVFIGMYKVPENLLFRSFRFKELLKINLISITIGYSLPAILLAVNGYGVWSMVIASICQIVLKAIILFSISPVSLKVTLSIRNIKDLTHFGAGITLIRFWNYLVQHADKFIVGKFLGATHLGYYHMASQLAILPGKYVGDILDNVLFSAMSEIQNEKQKLQKIYSTALTLGMLFMGLIGTFMALNGKEIIGIIYGEKWIVAANSFSILALGAVFRIGTRLSDALNRSVGVVYQAANRKMLLAVVTITFALVGNNWGVEGVAVAILFSNVFSFVVTSQLSTQSIDMQLTVFIKNIMFVFLCIVMLVLSNYIAEKYLVMSLDNNMLRLLKYTLFDASIFLVICYIFRTQLSMHLRQLIGARSKNNSV